jgi:triacylglycerol lipase
MTDAAGRYVDWLGGAAAQAEQSATQARVAATAVEAALATIVDPGLITANRGQLVSLVRSNLFGQNAPAIAPAEAEYEQMWARDFAAMFGYHSSASAAVAQLGSWEQALENLPGLPGEFAKAIGNPFASVQQAIPKTPMTPVAAITGVADEIFADIFGASAGLPIPATLGGTFTGKPSLITKFEKAGLWGGQRSPGHHRNRISTHTCKSKFPVFGAGCQQRPGTASGSRQRPAEVLDVTDGRNRPAQHI